MINLDHFKDVHPNWHVIENLETEQARATFDLLLMAAFINDELTPEESGVLDEEWKRLPFIDLPESNEQFTQKILDKHDHLNQIARNPKMFDGFMDDIEAAIDDEDVQFAVFRLLAITMASDGFDEAELDFCYAIGARFGLERDTIDDTIRSIWETHEEAVDLEAGREHHIPPVVGSGQAKSRRSLKPLPNPFSSRIPD